jgi:hypothetical protein
MAAHSIGPDTPLRDLPYEELFDLFIDAGVVMPWEVPRLRDDPRTLREVCELGDLDLEEIVQLLTHDLERLAGASFAQAQHLAQDGLDDA